MKKITESYIIKKLKDICGKENVLRFTGDPVGIPDILIVYHYDQTENIWLELKVNGTKTGAAQKAVLSKLKNAYLVRIDTTEQTIRIEQEFNTDIISPKILGTILLQLSFHIEKNIIYKILSV